MYRKIRSQILSIFLIVLMLFSAFVGSPAWAISDAPDSLYRVPLSKGTPDWSNISWDRMGVINGDNYGVLTDPGLIRTLGYNPSRAFSAGDRISTTIKVGDLDALGLGRKTFGSFLGNVDPNTVSLGAISALNGSSLKDLASSVPGLANAPVRSIPLFDSLLAGNGVEMANKNIGMIKQYVPEIQAFLAKNPWAADLPIEQLLKGDWKDAALSAALKYGLPALIKEVPALGQIPIGGLFNAALKGDINGIINLGISTTVSEFLKNNPALADLPLGVLTDLNNFSVGSIPNLVSTAITAIPGLKDQIIANVPGIAAVPLDALLGLLNTATAKIDFPDQGATAATRAFSGGGYTFKSEDCDGPCPNFEINSATSAIPLISDTLNGTQWVVGSLDSSKGQSVEGGRGPLKGFFGGKEPVHIRPWGDSPNVALAATNVTDETGMVDFSFYLRFCIEPPFSDKTCTPYGIGPIPFISLHQNDVVVIQAKGQVPPISGPNIVDECGGQGGTPPPSSNPNAPLSQQNMKRYLDRIALGESNLGTDLGPNYLGAYGKYQFIPATRASILRISGYDAWKPDQWDNASIALMKDVGGQQVINAIANGNFNYADRVLNRTWTSLPGGAEESRRWSNAATLAAYGPISKRPGGLGGGQGGGVLIAGDGGGCGVPKPCEEGKQCILLNPLPMGVVPYNGWYGAPRPGRIHSGQDLQSPKGYRNYPRGPGENIKAAGDGVVSEMVPVGGLCGGIVAIKHQTPNLETRYVHMVKVFVSQGQQVQRGQTIGVEGNETPDCSSAVHLHYEVYSGGSAVDPSKVPHEPPIAVFRG